MLSTTSRVKLIRKKEFVIAIFDQNYEAFIVYIAIFNISFDANDKVYPLKRIQIAHLKMNEALTDILNKDVHFADIFLLKLAIKLSKYTDINNHAVIS